MDLQMLMELLKRKQLEQQMGGGMEGGAMGGMPGGGPMPQMGGGMPQQMPMQPPDAAVSGAGQAQMAPQMDPLRQQLQQQFAMPGMGRAAGPGMNMLRGQSNSIAPFLKAMAAGGAGMAGYDQLRGDGQGGQLQKIIELIKSRFQGQPNY